MTFKGTIKHLVFNRGFNLDIGTSIEGYSIIFCEEYEVDPMIFLSGKEPWKEIGKGLVHVLSWLEKEGYDTQPYRKRHVIPNLPDETQLI